MHEFMEICECAFLKLKKGAKVYNEQGMEVTLTADVDPADGIAFCDDNKGYLCGTLYVRLSNGCAGKEPASSYETVKAAFFKEAWCVSRKLEKDPANKKLLGAWEALTSVMNQSSLMDEFNAWRNAEWRKEINNNK